LLVKRGAGATTGRSGGPPTGECAGTKRCTPAFGGTAGFSIKATDVKAIPRFPGRILVDAESAASIFLVDVLDFRPGAVASVFTEGRLPACGQQLTLFVSKRTSAHCRGGTATASAGRPLRQVERRLRDGDPTVHTDASRVTDLGLRGDRPWLLHDGREGSWTAGRHSDPDLNFRASYGSVRQEPLAGPCRPQAFMAQFRASREGLRREGAPALEYLNSKLSS
jgi:hypothetical protein